jgi:hypothetical protein
MERLMAERARQDTAYFPGTTASADTVAASADLQYSLQKPSAVAVPRPVPGAGLLRQLTPSFSPKREATVSAETESTAEAEDKPTGPCWSLSS